MSTYYDELGLSPQASAAELETALDARYNQYRNLVTHPKPDVRADAERNLRLVEQMRAELLDPNRRAVYDANVDLGGAGGLADPTARTRPAPPTPKKSPASSAAGVADLWRCPSCGTLNPEGSLYCLSCRSPLLRECPACGQMKSLVKTGVCSNCGSEYAKATKRTALHKEIQALNEQLTARRAELGVATKRLATVQSSQQDSGSRQASRIRFYSVAIGGSILAAFVFLIIGSKVDSMLCFGSALLFVVIGVLNTNSARTKDQKSQQEMLQLPQQVATLKAEVERLENELQGKRAALGRLGQ